MTKIDFICILMWVLWPEEMAAQTVSPEPIRFSGVVMNRETTDPLPAVNCRRGEWVTATDRMGRFALDTQAGDTIFFTHIGMQQSQVVVPDTLNGGEYI
ncbi:MAG: hypothetical protein K2I47_05085, partial [Odoribacter sp.]|nr:hypothetical protein [Odoribacter sp.]